MIKLRGEPRLIGNLQKIHWQDELSLVISQATQHLQIKLMRSIVPTRWMNSLSEKFDLIVQNPAANLLVALRLLLQHFL